MIHISQNSMFSFSGDGQDYDYEIGGSFGDTSGPEVQILPTTFTVTQTVFATGDIIFCHIAPQIPTKSNLFRSNVLATFKKFGFFLAPKPQTRVILLI